VANKQCPHCGHLNPTAAALCGECGQSLPVGRPCPGCGFTDNPSRAAYCIQCGASLRRRSLIPFIWLGGLALVLLLAGAIVLWQAGLFEEWVSGWFAPSVGRPATATIVSLVEETYEATLHALTTSPPTHTPIPSSTPTQSPSATPPPTATQLPTATPPPTATLPPTHTPSPTPCAVAVYGAFSRVWQANADQLGCPSSAGKSGVWMAEEDFQRGRVFWREDNDKIYVLYSNGSWERYDDIWREGDPVFTCGTQSSPPTPLRGFGKVWCTYSNVRQGLGDATNSEWGEYGAVQDFSGGLILQTGSGRIYIFYSDGTWRQ